MRCEMFRMYDFPSSDSFGSSSPGGPEPSMLNITSHSRSNSPADSNNSPVSTPDGNLAELLVRNKELQYFCKCAHRKLSITFFIENHTRCRIILYYSLVRFDLQNSITLGDALIGNVLGNFDLKGNLDLLNLQNLQAVHALKYLQQPPSPVLNTLLNSPHQRQVRIYPI